MDTLLAAVMGATVWQQRRWECFHLSMPFVHQQWRLHILHINNGDRPRDFSKALPQGVHYGRWEAAEIRAVCYETLRVLSAVHVCSHLSC